MKKVLIFLIAVLGLLSLDGQQHARFSARSGRRFLPDHEILRMQRRQVAREAFERGAPHAGDQVYDEREGDDGQCQAPCLCRDGHVEGAL